MPPLPDTLDEAQLERLIVGLSRARRITVLTGAGISTESGLPDFRSPGGLWEQYDPTQLATVEALESQPLRFFEFYQRRLATLADASPNAAHHALAELQRRGRIGLIATQNVDGLHQKAGSTDVAELHGTLSRAHCHRCRLSFPPAVLQTPIRTILDIPRCPDCGGIIRPSVVLFGELLPEAEFHRALEAAERCDAMLVVGSSLEVYPAAGLPQAALDHGASLFIVNLSETPYDHVAEAVVHARAGAVLPRVAAALGGAAA